MLGCLCFVWCDFVLVYLLSLVFICDLLDGCLLLVLLDGLRLFVFVLLKSWVVLTFTCSWCDVA